MKIIAICSFLMLLTATVNAGNVEVLSDGSMRIKQESVDVVSEPDITVTQDALKYSQWRKAIENPDETVWVKESTKYYPKGFYIKKKVKKIGVLYDTKTKKVDVVSVESDTKLIFNHFFTLMIMSIVFMVIANGITYKNKTIRKTFVISTTLASVFAAFIAFVAVAILVILAATIVATTTLIAIATTTALAITLVIPTPEIMEEHGVKIRNVIFYIFAIASILLMYFA